MTLTSLLCSDPASYDQDMQEDDTTAEAGDDNGHQHSSSSSSPSKTDQKMLDYFMEFSNSSDENRKKLTRRVKHRINNKRHRQRKQVELDQLRRDVPDLERQLRGLEAVVDSRRTTAAQTSLWHQQVQAEKKKLDEAVEERDLLHQTIKAHEVLVALYESQLHRPHTVVPWLQENNRPSPPVPPPPPPPSSSASSSASTASTTYPPSSSSSSSSPDSTTTTHCFADDNHAARQPPCT